MALYDRLLTSARREPDPLAEGISVEDFELRAERLEEALDVIAVCRA